ncbi:hypothetical protein SeMB42_g03942 [Synchytrium endobioticum]|uniref:26S proteasome regulatory subunit RPN2 n=1 Tax=Synchytrium endobioticum TaxID=286115 RepID=A0A507D2L5_9FUNG|nr:hypothetical protein SeMB42_g03942 [Synchytrium endobioticum]TPX46876.1 hypothetical protein SeLEV6574_g02967 [Synchytrium endobioticum]
MVTLTSAAGVISLLDEREAQLKVYALQTLNSIVDQFWAEISDAVSKIEILYEDEKFGQRRLAALVASKVYYHLGEYNDSLQFALKAGELFDPSVKTEYVETIVSKCIDKFIAERTQQHENPTAGMKVDKDLEDVVERMFQRCYNDKEYRQAIGIALESRRLDVIERACLLDPTQTKDLLVYVLESSMTLVQHITFRNEVLRLLVRLYKSLPEPDYFSMSQCLVHLDDYESTAELLKTLVRMDEKHSLIAYQIAFDLETNATQFLLQKVSSSLPGKSSTKPADSNAMDVDSSAGKAPADPHEVQFVKIQDILTGQLAIKLNLEFLTRNNHTDLAILKATKNALESRNSVYHSAITFANAFQNCGTTSDEFLRQNLEWLSRASNWTKFSATAGLGVIHKGQIAHGKAILGPYLPQDGVSGSAYSEGGALFALGLIHANHGAGVIDYLTNALKNTQSEVVQHGACLGLGVASMGSDSEDIFDDLKNVLFSESAVAGEAAGLAMGLVMLGTGSDKALNDMLPYAHETQHEKIIRGLAVGMALIAYGREEQADVLIEQLVSDKDPILRYGGIYAISLAYAGTGNNKAIRKLLHVAVSDVNDDVRRAAVMGLGFVLFRQNTQVPKLVQLLSESYNPHVRYGATLALGIACAATGMAEALELLDPMLKDPVDFVRQGALIANAMILIQHNESMSSRVASVRKTYEKIISDKHEEQMAKFGATMGQGILDAGGRNVTVSLSSRNGYLNRSAIVGMALFTQFWYWYPLTHFLSLAFTPTAVICLNNNLDIPKLEMTSNAKPSMFAYPPALKPPTVEKVEKIETAILSTTQKAKARARKAEKEKGDAMETDEKKEEKKDLEMKDAETKNAEMRDVDDVSKKDDEKGDDKKDEKKKRKKEESFEVLSNMARVLPQQLKYVTFKNDARYAPLKSTISGGILIVEDRKPSEPEEVVPLTAPSAAQPGAASNTSADENEPKPPEPFEYHED